MDRNQELECYDYVNKNYWNGVPMTEDSFRQTGFADVLTIGPNVSGESYLIGVHADGHVSGYFDPQRQVGCLSPQ